MCLGKTAEDGPSIWAPATDIQELDEAPGSSLQPGPALATVAISGVNQQMEDISLSPSSSLSVTLFLK